MTKIEPRKNKSSISDSNWTIGNTPIGTLLICSLAASVMGFHRKCDVTFHNSCNIVNVGEFSSIFSVFL